MELDSYQIIRPLGRGAHANTHLGVGPDGREVAIKQLDFARVESWKAVELFEREVDILRTLSHPRIPAFIDAVRTDGEFYLVQEYIPGESLDALIARGPLSEAEAVRCAAELLEVLCYLGELLPPLVHRDIKPANIVRRPDGGHVLVDFGAVQTVLPSDTGGSTIVGTTGYMPPEQLAGRATPQSDLYGLGATLAHLVTGKHPADLPTVRLKLQWRSGHTFPEALGALIDACLEPTPEDRPADARAALAILRAPRPGSPLAALAPTVARTDQLATVGDQAPSLPEGVRPGWLDNRVKYPGDRMRIVIRPMFEAWEWWLAAGLVLTGIAVGAAFAGVGFAGWFLWMMFDHDARVTLDMWQDGRFRLARGLRERFAETGHCVGVTAGESPALLCKDGEAVSLAFDLDEEERRWLTWEIHRWLNPDAEAAAAVARRGASA